MKNTLKLGFIVLVVTALVTAGLAFAQTDDSDGSPDEAPTLATRILEHLAPLIEDGTISEDQASAVADHLAAVAPPRRMDGPRPGADHGRRPGPQPGPGRIAFDVVADTIGIDIASLREGLMDGQTLGEIAAANGSSAEAVIDALVAEVDEHLTDAVANGRIDEERKAEILADATERITTAVNDGLPERPAIDGRPGRRGPDRGGFAGGGFEPPAEDAGLSA